MCLALLHWLQELLFYRFTSNVSQTHVWRVHPVAVKKKNSASNLVLAAVGQADTGMGGEVTVPLSLSKHTVTDSKDQRFRECLKKSMALCRRLGGLQRHTHPSRAPPDFPRSFPCTITRYVYALRDGTVWSLTCSPTAASLVRVTPKSNSPAGFHLDDEATGHDDAVNTLNMEATANVRMYDYTEANTGGESNVRLT